jgi:Ca2+/Na+ antiporter
VALATRSARRDAPAAMTETKKDAKAGGFKVPAWGWVLVVGLALALTLHFVHVEGALGAVLEMIGGLLLIGGSCEALIIAVEGGSAILGLSKFVGGTFAAVVSNIPEIALLGFFVVDDPTMAFIIGMMSIYTNSMTFALYAVLLPKDRGAAKIPAPIVKAGTDLLSFGGGLCLALAGAMIVLREFDSPITTLGAPELAFVGGALFLVFVTFLVTLVKTSKEDAAQGHPSEGRARDSQPVEAVNVEAAKADAAHDDHEGVPKTMAGVLGLLAIGVVGSFLGGHAMSDVGDFIVETFPGLSNMVVALILAIISGVPTYVIVGNAHLKKQSLIALSNTFGGLTQNLFNTMAICCLMIAGFNWIGVLDHTTIPINAATTLSVLFIYPTYSILSRAIEDDGKFNWIEIVSLLALFSFLVFLLTREL